MALLTEDESQIGSYDDLDDRMDNPEMGETPDFTDPVHKQLLSHWTERFRYSESGKKRRDKMGQAAYQHYRSWVNEQAFPFPTDVYDPHFFSTLDTHIARETSALHGSDPIIRFSPKGNTRKDQSEKMSLLVAHHLSTQRLRLETVDAMWSRHMLGTAIMFNGWEYIERDASYVQNEAIPHVVPQYGPDGMPAIDPMTGMPLTTTQWVQGKREVRGRKVFRDRPRSWHVRWQDFFPDQSVPWVEEGAFFMVRKMRPKSWIREKAQAGQWHPNNTQRALKQGCSSSYGGSSLEGLMETLDWQGRVGFETIRQWDVEKRKWFEVLECWTPTSYTIIIDRSYIVLHTTNPFRHGKLPFCHIKNHIIPGEFYGMSDYEVVHKLIKNLQVMRNASASEAVMSVFPPIAMPKGQGQDIKELKHRPFAIWRGVDPKRAQFMTRPTQGYQIANQEIQASRWGIDSTLGSPDGFRGADADPNLSATSQNLSNEGAGTRSGFAVANIQECYIFEMGSQWADNVAQFQSWPQAVKIFDDPAADPKVIYPDELQDLETDVDPVATGHMLQIQEQQRIMQIYQMAVQFQEPNADRRELWGAMCESVSPAFRVRTMRPLADVATELAMKAQANAAADQLQSAGAEQNPTAQTLGSMPTGTGRPRGPVVEMPALGDAPMNMGAPNATNQGAAEIRQSAA